MNATQRVLTLMVLRHKGYITLFIGSLFITDFYNFDSAKPLTYGSGLSQSQARWAYRIWSSLEQDQILPKLSFSVLKEPIRNCVGDGMPWSTPQMTDAYGCAISEV